MLELIWRENHCIHPMRKVFLKISIGTAIADIFKYLTNQSFTIISAQDLTLTPLGAMLFDQNDWSCG